MKNSTSLKKELVGDRYWTIIKEIVGWEINTHRGTLALSSKKCLKLISLLEIPDRQRRISGKKLEHLISTLRSMHLAMPEAIGHFYAMQVSLTRDRAAKRAADYLSNKFHQDIKFWRNLCVDMTDLPT